MIRLHYINDLGFEIVLLEVRNNVPWSMMKGIIRTFPNSWIEF